MCGDMGGFRRVKHSASLFHTATLYVRMVVTWCVCQTKTDSITSTHFSDQQYTAKDRRALGLEDLKRTKRLLLLNCVFRVGTSNLEGGRCNTIQICVHETFLFGPKTDQTLQKQRKQFAQRMSEAREFDCVPLKRAARYLVWKPTAATRFRRQEHVDKITVFVDGDFAGDPVSRKSTTGLVAQVGAHTQ